MRELTAEEKAALDSMRRDAQDALDRYLGKRIRNGWVIRRDRDQSDGDDATWWTGEAWSGAAAEAIFFATEADADKVARRVLIGIPTAIDWIWDPRGDLEKTTGRQVGGVS